MCEKPPETTGLVVSQENRNTLLSPP